ncbi:MAG TPA: exopolysaccharide transport family protein [Rhizomicrobium sp.]|nr:exopolysaccharide transport family protein [Rhizomicrobium sp.]
MSSKGVNPTLAGSTAPSGASPQLADIIDMLRAGAGTIIAVTAIVVAATLVVLLLMPVRYTSTAAVMIDQRKNTVADLNAVLSQLPTDPSSLQNQIQIIQSRDLAAKVIGDLKLYNDPEFNPALTPNRLAALNPKNWFGPTGVAADADVQRDAIIDTFLSHIYADTIGLSTTIDVSVSSHDPEKAARIANALSDAYVNSQLDSKLAAIDHTAAWLTKRIHDLAGQVQEQEAAALIYKAQNNLDSSVGGTSLVDAQLGAINTQLIQARADLAAKLAVYDQVRALIKAGTPGNISQIVASPLIIQLRAQQAELIRQQADDLSRYGPKHPKMVAIEGQLRDLNEKIDEEVSRVASSLAGDVAVSRAQLGSLQGSFVQTQRQAASQDMTAIKLKQLEANARSTRNLYDAFLTRLHNIQDEESLQFPDARVISRAPVSTTPGSPPKMLIALASVPAGLLLGCLLVLAGGRIRQYLPERKRAVAQPAENDTSPPPPPALPPIIAELPGLYASGAAEHVLDWPASPFSRAIRALLDRVATARGGSGRIVSVTSAESSDESGSTVALALVRAAAASGLKAVLVDGHLGSPRLSRLGVHPSNPGMTDALQGKVALSRVFQRDSRSGALLLMATRPLLDPRAALNAPRTAELFAHLKTMCDLVIIDAPSVLGAPETPYLTRLSDAVVLVTRQDERHSSAFGRALSALSSWKSPPVGLAIAR